MHFRKSHLLVAWKAEAPIDSPRAVKTEQSSRNRWYCDIKIASVEDIDAESFGWAAVSYGLSGPKP